MQKLFTVFLSFFLGLNIFCFGQTGKNIDSSLKGIYGIQIELPPKMQTDPLNKKGIFGTGSVIKHKDKQYIITARHLFNGLGIMTGDSISIIIILGEKNNVVIKAKVFFHNDADVDIAILAPNLKLPYELNCKIYKKPLEASIYVGQQVFLAGFPILPFKNGGSFILGTPINDSLQLPSLHSMMVSGFKGISSKEKIFFQGLSFQGMSGGPILYFHKQEKQPYLVGINGGSFPYPVSNREMEPSEIYFINSNIVYASYFNTTTLEEILPSSK